MAVFSFQINKNMTCGEGGCVVTNDLNFTNALSPATIQVTCATKKAARSSAIRHSICGDTAAAWTN